MNKQSVVLPGTEGAWGSYISKYQPDSNKVLDNMFTSGSKNFVTDQTGMIQKRQGGVQWNRTAFSEAAQDTYEAVFESGFRHFLRVGGGVLSASTGTGLFDVITSGYSALGNFEWATYQNRTYGCNGINAPQTYDIVTSYGGVPYVFTTAKTKEMGAQAPSSAPTAGAPSAGGAVPIGPHTYKVTFMYYESEESNGSTASAVQTTTAGVQTIALTAIPVGGYGVTARNIYRDNNDGNYLLLDTIPNNTATTYNDVLMIGSTPTPMPQFNNVPPTFSKIALWNDSLFIAPTGETSTIRFSNSGSPDVFDPGNFVTCQSDDIITALFVYNGKLYVFGLHSFGSIEGNTPDTYFYRNISTLIGCVDNRSIQVRSIVSVPTLWWLSDKGFYFSNGNTVEYGSDLIQDLVNLNLAQVNYSTNKNTQSSFADFSGDTYTPGIDINTNPGAFTTFNPTVTFSSQAAWEGGSVTTNLKTLNNNFAEVPTKFAPASGSGTYSQTTASGSNVVLNTTHYANTNLGLVSSPNPGVIDMDFYSPSNASTVTSVTLPGGTVGAFVFGSTVTGRVYDWNTSTPVSPPFTLGTFGSGGGSWSPQTFTSTFSVSPSTRYAIRLTGGAPGGSITQLSQGNTFLPFGSYSTIGVPFYAELTFGPTSGTWLSATYDSLCTLQSSGMSLQVTASYPSGSSSTVLVQGSTNGSSWTTTDTLASPNGTISLTGGAYRFWRIQYTLNNGTATPVLSFPMLRFNTTATWESQPIDTTTDNTGWGTLTYTGNVPLGTTVTLTIATSNSQFSGYSAYGPIGSALVQRWAKVRMVLTTDSDNATSPSVASVTLNWNLTSTLTSSITDTGTIPAGFSTFQWEQTVLGVGTVTFSIRTAASAGAIPAASWVVVNNGSFPNLSALEYVQWKAVLSSTPNATPEITSVTVNWYTSSGTAGVRCASLFYNKTYYVSVATLGSTANNTLIQLDQFGNWRVQKDTSIGCFLSYFNTLYFTSGTDGLIFNGFIADTDNGVAITMDVRTKAWNAENDLFLKVPRAFKVTGLNTGTTLHAYYSVNRGATWTEMLNESGVTGYPTSTDGTEFVTLFVPDATTLISGRTLMFRIVSADVFPCSIINYVPSFYSRKGRFLNNG
jgi:hypothetical protein